MGDEPVETGCRPLYVRCRKADCLNYEDDSIRFATCGRCQKAKYCSRECQKVDWLVHKLMCLPPKGEKATKIEEADVNNVVFTQGLSDKISIHTHPFALYQKRKRNEMGFLFVQCPHPLAEYRYTSKVDAAGNQLDRQMIVHFLTMAEFTTDVLPSPAISAALKAKNLAKELKKLLSQCPPQNDDDNNNAEKKHIVILFIFGCDRIFTLKQELLPYNTLLNVIQEQEKEFSKGCLELHLDR